MLRTQLTLYDNLYERNKRAVDFVLRAKTVGVLAEQRVGKTWITGGIIEALIKDGFRALIICPKTNKFTTWVKFLEEQLPQCGLYQGFDEWKEFKDKKGVSSRIYLLHWEELNKGRMIHWIKNYTWTFIAVDESQRAKRHGNVSSRRIAQLRNSAEYKVILSGTPMDKQQFDLWGQMRFVKPDLFGTNWGDFTDSYLKPTGFELRNWRFKKGMLDVFMEEITPWVIRISLEEAGILRPKIIPVRISLLGTQREIYDTYENDLIVEYKELKLITDLKLTHKIKLAQMTGGHVKDKEGIVHEIGRAKERRLIYLMEKNKPPMVVFCKYTHELHRLKIRISREFDFDRVELLYGKVKDTEKDFARTRLLTEFQEGKIDVLICQEKTGGVGVDMYVADYGFLYSTGFSFINFDQVTARLTHKDRDTSPILYMLIAKNTVDEDIYSSLQSKKSVSVEFWKRIRRKGNASKKGRVQRHHSKKGRVSKEEGASKEEGV